GNTVFLKFVYFSWKNSTASATKNHNVFSTSFFQQIIHVFKILHMSPLITCHCDGMSIFFNGTVHNLVNTAVVAKVNDLCTTGLNDSSHDIDGCIMTIEKGCCSHNSDFVFGDINGYF